MKDEQPKYEVVKVRIGDLMHIYVSDGHTYLHLYPYYSKAIPLRRRWWHFRSPAERIRAGMAKAEAEAKKLNHQELYLNHEAQLSRREG